MVGKPRKRIRLDAMLAGESADIEQPRLGRIQPCRIERQHVSRTRNLVLGFASLDQRTVERGQRLAEQGVVGGTPLDAARGQAELRKCPVGAAQQFVDARQALARLEAGLHRGTLLREPCLLPGFRRQGVDLGQRMRQILAVAFRGRKLLPCLQQCGLNACDLRPGFGHGREVQAPKRVQQRTVAARIEQAPFVVLAVNFHRQGAYFPKQASGHGRGSDEGAAAAV